MLFLRWGNILQLLFDYALLKRRLRRPGFRPASNPFLAAIADDLSSRLFPIKRDFPLALSLYPPAAAVDEALRGNGKIGTLEIHAWQDAGNLETLALEVESFDLVVSCLGLQYANDLPGVLVQLRRALKPGGMLLGCLIGGDSLSELRAAFAQAETEITGGITPRIHPSIDIRQLGSLLQRVKFGEPIVDVDKFDLSYENMTALLNDLQQWSPGNLLIERSRKFLPRKVLKRAGEVYAEKNSADGKLLAPFDLIWFSGWAA